MDLKNINRIMADLGFYHRLLWSPGNPTIHNIELTNVCNLRCPMCPYPSMKRKKGFMEFSLFVRIIDQIKNYNSLVMLHHFGEPLLHPQLDKFIEHCQREGVNAGLSTNAALLDQEKASMLLETNIHTVVCSLDGITPGTHEFFRKGSSYATTLGNVEYFLQEKIRRKKKTRIIVSIIRMKGTESEVDVFVKNWTREGIDEIWTRPFTLWDGTSDEVRKYVLDEDLEKKQTNPQLEYPCKDPWRRLTILWDGRVVPCCFDYDGRLVLGDMTTNTLKEIWNSPRMKEFRRMHLDNKFPENHLCAKCLDKFEPAPAESFYPLNRLHIIKRLFKRG